MRSMGGSRFRIMWEVLIPEALPSLISGFVVTLVTLIGSSGAGPIAPETSVESLRRAIEPAAAPVTFNQKEWEEKVRKYSAA